MKRAVLGADKSANNADISSGFGNLRCSVLLNPAAEMHLHVASYMLGLGTWFDNRQPNLQSSLGATPLS